MEQETEVKTKNYYFHLNGEKGIYEIAFRIDNDNVESTCTCDYHSDKKLCWHRHYILAGKTHRIPEKEFAQQQELIQRLQKTSGGRDMISHAKRKFGEKETCRRCNSSNVIDIKKSFRGKIIGIFLPDERQYFCMSCRWSW